MAEVGKVTYAIRGDNSKFESDVNETKQTAERASTSIGTAFAKAVAGLALTKKAYDAVIATIKTGIEYNAQMEKYTVALTTALGDEESALRAVAAIKEDAARTPFDFAGLTQANMLLISAGESAEDARATILALGDAVAATGGGSDELSRMASNLQQIKNVGKATAMDIRQFAMAGIDIYGLLADYTHKTTAEVKDMDVSYDLLSAALRSAASEGGKYFNAMNNQSKTFNGQLSTIKDNAKALAGEVMEGVFRKLADDVLPALNKAIQDIDADAIAGIINGIIEALQNMLPLIVSATGAWVAYKAAMKIKDDILAAAEAMKKMYAVLSANPIMLVVSAIAALAAVVATMITQLTTYHGEYKSLVGALEETKKQHKENADAITKEKNNTVAMVKVLDDLLKKEDKTIADKATIKSIVDDLNEAIPDLNAAYSEEADALNMATDAIYAMAEAEAYRLMMEDKYAELVELKGQEIELTKALEEEQAALGMAEAQLEELRNKSITSMGDYTTEIGMATQEVAKHKYEVDNLSNSLTETGERIAEVEGDMNGYSTAMNDAANTTDTATAKMEKALSDYKTEWKSTHEAVKKSIESEIGLFEDMSIKGDKSINDLIQSLQSQIDYMDTYADNIQEAMERGIDDGLIKQLSDGSKESAEILAGIVHGSDAEIAKLNENWKKTQEGKETFAGVLTDIQTESKKKMQEIKYDFLNGIKELNMQDAAYESGKNTIFGFINGMEKYESKVREEASYIGRLASKSLNSSLKVNSPSKVTEETGYYFDAGYAEGMIRNITMVEKASEKVSRAAVMEVNRYNTTNIGAPLSRLQMSNNTKTVAPVVLNIDGREVARSTAIFTSEQMAWEEM